METRRNHYNPCFWTALWNQKYFTAFTQGVAAGARKQPVFALNIRADKILQTTVERLFYDTGIGLAAITPESMGRFTQRYHPDHAQGMAEYVRTNNETLYLDFEPTLSQVETLAGYDAILRAARTGTLQSAAHKGFVACALVMHAMRSHEMMTTMLEQPNPMGLDAWEYLWLLKQAWGNRLLLARAVTPLALGEWMFWRTTDHSLPLCDSPVIIGRDSVLAILSPRLLLTIDLHRSQPQEEWIIRDGMPVALAAEVQARTLGNTFKALAFSDQETLAAWQVTTAYTERRALLGDRASRLRCLREATMRVLWLLAGAGRVPDDFESWIGRVFDRPGAEQETEAIRRAWSAST